MTPELTPEESARLLQDPLFFASTLQWKGQPFVPNTAQKYLLSQQDLRVTLRLPRRSGATVGLAIRALYRALFWQDQEILYATPVDLSYYRDILGELLHGSPYAEYVKTVNSHLIRFRNGSVIRFLSLAMVQAGRAGICGVGADEVLVDNARFVPEDLWRSLLPILAGDTRRAGKVRALFTTTGLRYDKDHPPFLVCLIQEGWGRGWSHGWLSVTDLTELSELDLLECRKLCPTAREWRTEYLAEFVPSDE
jgi:hypothetical protein